jgi:predicted nucleotidyltransferase
MIANQVGLKQSDLDAIIKVMKTYESIEKVILFGSRAKGTYRNGSDIDLAIKGNLGFQIITRVSYLLNQESMMPYKFDIINYSKIQNRTLKEHIDRVGIVLYPKICNRDYQSPTDH